ncbi:MAG: thiol peroxidase [Planctomycetia bacterium]|nr:thiol peroxidase [Planctomycetia bacterium]
MARTVTFKKNPVNLAGNELKPGDSAPSFKGLKGLDAITLADTPAKARLFSVVPSLDTGVCSAQTKKFDEGVKALGDSVASYTVSLDLPFAQGRFCSAEGISTMKTISDVHDHSFGKNWGVLIESGLPLKLLTRAVFVVGKDGKITYAEYVPEVTDHPNYDAALNALKAAAK